MNNKYLAGEALPISIFSYFHKGFLWGIIFSWITGLSFAMGAVITKSAYLDRQEYRLAAQTALSSKSLPQNKSTLSSKRSNSSAKVKQQNKQSSFLFPQISLLSTKFASLSQQKYLRLNFLNFSSKQSTNESLAKPNKLLVSQASAKKGETVKLQNYSNNSDQHLTYVVDSQSQHSALDKFSSINEIKIFKQTKILIGNSPDYPELAKYITAYLKERDFLNIEITETDINFQTSQKAISQLDLTIIRTDSHNFESANYLKNVLGFGSLELVPSGFLNANESSELILLLGNDAQIFSQNQDFVSLAE